MGSKCTSHKSMIHAIALAILMSAVWFAIPVYAQQSVSDLSTNLANLSPQTMLASIQSALPNLTKLATAFAYVMGMFLVIMGIVHLKHAGEMRTQMSHEHHLSKPLTMIAVGALLIYFPSTVQMGLSTFWTTPNPYGYITQSDQWQQAINVCFAVVQFIGVVSFIRGLMVLSHGGGGHQQGQFAKGITHIIGGIFCINIYQVIQVIAATLGAQ